VEGEKTVNKRQTTLTGEDALAAVENLAARPGWRWCCTDDGLSVYNDVEAYDLKTTEDGRLDASALTAAGLLGRKLA
jgi:hypothetical protein